MFLILAMRMMVLAMRMIWIFGHEDDARSVRV